MIDKKFTRVVLVADKPTRNGTIYPESVLQKAVEDSQELVKSRRWLGNATGKYPVSLNEATHIITGLRMEAGAMVADIEFLDTPAAKEVLTIIEAVAKQVPGADIKLYPAGVGSTSPQNVVRGDYKLGSISVEWAPFEKDVRAENDELNRLFNKQHTRVQAATQRWREATGEHLTQPDLGTLVQWLLDGRDEVERENAELKADNQQLGAAVARIRARKCPTHDSPCSCCQAHWSALDEEVGDAVVTRAVNRTGERTPSALYEENLKLKAAVRHHASQLDDDRCWLDDQELYAAAGIDCKDAALPSKEEFLANCARYHASRQNPEHKYTTVDEKIRAAVFADRKRIAAKLDEFKVQGRRAEFDEADILED